MTGGAGYIGRHTCVELLNSGIEIVVIDNFSNSDISVIEQIKEITQKEFAVIEGNVEDRNLLSTIFDNHQFDGVIHLAGLKAVGESVQFPLKYYNNNIVSTLVLCEVMNQYNCKKLVFSSSATVYGNPQSTPIKENSDIQSTNPYGRTKSMIENILYDLYESDHEWSILLLRYFNPIGAHPSGLIGEDPKGVPNNLLPYITKVALGELDSLKVYGRDYDTKDGTGIRDYIHVVDLSIGHVRALEKVIDGCGVDAFNLGTGQGYSVLEVINSFEKASGRKIKYKFVDRRAGDIAECFADTEKAKTYLGWESVRTIDEMCSDAWRYVVERERSNR